MAVLVYAEFPFGGRAAALSKLTAEPATYAAKTDFPRLEIFELTEEEDSTEMNAGDVQQAIHTFSTRLTGTIQGGGLNMDSVGLITGGTVATTGTTPNRITSMIRRSTQTKPYFKAEAQLYGDDAGDLHIVAYKVKAESGPSLGSNQGEFMSTNAPLRGVYTAEVPGKLYDLIANETVTAIA